MDFLVSAPQDLERPEQRSEVCQQGICPSILTHAVAIADKIDEREVINVLEDLESPDPHRKLDYPTAINMDDGQHAPLIQTDTGAREPQVPVMVCSKVKTLCDHVRSPISW